MKTHANEEESKIEDISEIQSVLMRTDAGEVSLANALQDACEPIDSQEKLRSLIKS